MEVRVQILLCRLHVKQGQAKCCQLPDTGPGLGLAEGQPCHPQHLSLRARNTLLASKKAILLRSIYAWVAFSEYCSCPSKSLRAYCWTCRVLIGLSLCWWTMTSAPTGATGWPRQDSPAAVSTTSTSPSRARCC